MGFRVFGTEFGGSPAPCETPWTGRIQRTLPMPYSFSVPKTFKIGEWERVMAKWIPTPLAVMKREGSRAPRQWGVSVCPAVTIAG